MNQTSRPWTIQCFHGTAYVTMEKDTPFNDGKELSKDMTKKTKSNYGEHNGYNINGRQSDRSS
jgi:hypothetical protein